MEGRTIPYPMKTPAGDHCGWRTEGSICHRKEGSRVLGPAPAVEQQMPFSDSFTVARALKSPREQKKRGKVV